MHIRILISETIYPELFLHKKTHHNTNKINLKNANI